MNCKTCLVPMKIGIALYPYVSWSVRYIMPNNDLAETIVSVFKCPKCGYSVDKVDRIEVYRGV
jgi:hypothetical protein